MGIARVLRPAERVIYAIEWSIKRPLFGCQMCGQCIVRSTAFICPMQCPKQLRNGSCGGPSLQGRCEVYPDRRCIWVRIYKRSKRLGRLHKLTVLQPAIDHRMVKKTASWLNLLTGKIDIDGHAIKQTTAKGVSTEEN